MKDKDKSLDDIVSIIDSLMSSGVGRVSIDTSEGEEIKVNTVNSTDCSTKKGACCQETEFFDDED